MRGVAPDRQGVEVCTIWESGSIMYTPGKLKLCVYFCVLLEVQFTALVTVDVIYTRETEGKWWTDRPSCNAYA